MKILLEVDPKECSNRFLTDVCIHTKDRTVIEEIARFIWENPEHKWNKDEKYGDDDDLYGISIAITENQLASTKAIDYLCHCKDSLVRETVAESPYITQEAMSFLANDNRWEVIMALINNPVLNNETFDYIFGRVMSGDLGFNSSEVFDFKELVMDILKHKFINPEQKKLLRYWIKTRLP